MRVGTAGGIQEKVKVRDIVLAMSTHTDSAINKIRFNGQDFSPTASFDLLKTAYDTSINKGITPHVGTVLTSDTFYNDDPNSFKKWAKFGALAIEMETAALYTLAAKYSVNALTLLTISDHLITGELTSSEERQTTFTAMMEIALETALKL